jgi:phosphatidylglycerophosphate synthase
MTTSTTTTPQMTPETGPATDVLAGILVPGPGALGRVAGVELARRATIVLRRHGCQRVLVRGGDPTIVARLAGDERAQPVESWSAEGAPSKTVVLAGGDVVFPVALLAELARRGSERGAFAANDAGIVFVGPATVAAELASLLERGDLASARARASDAATCVEDPTLRLARTKGERRNATRAILRATAKAVDGPLTRLFERRISQTISSALLPLPVSPNVMTTVSFAIGLTGAFLLATTGYESKILGAALFVFATIVDGCDGEIARSKFMESPFGKLYDTAVDIVVNAAVFLGIGIGTWRELEGVDEVRLATLLLVGGGVFAMAVVESVRRLAPVASPTSVLGRAQGWLEWFATIEWCYLVLGLAIIGQVPFFFFGAAVGANVFALVYLGLGILAWRRA